MQNNSVREKPQYAGFWVRFFAYGLDMSVVFIGMGLVRILLRTFFAFFGEDVLSGNILFHFDLTDILVYLFKVGYFTLLTVATGTTLGKKLMHLQVIREGSEGEKPGFFDVFYRESVGRFLSAFFLYVGYIMAGIDKEKRGLHDILCRTRVVYDGRKPANPQVKTSVYQPVIGSEEGFIWKEASLEQPGEERRIGRIPEDIIGGYSFHPQDEGKDTGEA